MKKCAPWKQACGTCVFSYSENWFLWTSHFLSGIFNQNIWVVRLCSPEAIDQNTYQTPRWFRVCHHFASQLNECWTSLINLRLALFYHPLRIVVMSYSRPQVFVLANYKSTVFGRLVCEAALSTCNHQLPKLVDREKIIPMLSCHCPFYVKLPLIPDKLATAAAEYTIIKPSASLLEPLSYRLINLSLKLIK